jgi:hypothetical protein
MQASGFLYICAKFFPGIGFRKDALTQRPSHKATLFRLANLKDQFHANSITEVWPVVHPQFLKS